MKCTNPRVGWKIGLALTKDGVMSPKITFSEREAVAYHSSVGTLQWIDDYALQFPCGHCLACMIRKRKDWTTRLQHEISCFPTACFITLTYDEANVPIAFSRGRVVNSLSVRDVQLFVKRLRRHLEYLPKLEKNRIGRDHVTSKIRYFVVGEYGPKTLRPHYHIVVFGWSPSDVKPFFRSKAGQQVYRSAQVEKLWTLGFATVESCGCGTAQYCAQYVTKKLTKKPHPFVDIVQDEFFRYSTRNGGIGVSWLRNFYRECLKVDQPFVTYRNGKNILKAAVPVAYRRWIRKNRIPAYLEWRDKMKEHLMKARLEGLVNTFDWEANQRAIDMDMHRQEEFFARCVL